MIKAVFFDVDGTLVSHAENEVPASTRRSINKLKERNIKCVVATGRHMLELAELPVRDIEFDGYITLNGQLCLDDRRSVICGTPISGKDKEQIIRLFEEQRLLDFLHTLGNPMMEPSLQTILIEAILL